MSLTGVQNELPEVSAGLLGARWAQGGRQGRSETVAGRLLGLCWRLLGPSWVLAWGALGASWRRLGRPGGCAVPPRRRPESLREAILGATFAMHARGISKSQN